MSQIRNSKRISLIFSVILIAVFVLILSSPITSAQTAGKDGCNGDNKGKNKVPTGFRFTDSVLQESGSKGCIYAGIATMMAYFNLTTNATKTWNAEDTYRALDNMTGGSGDPINVSEAMLKIMEKFGTNISLNFTGNPGKRTHPLTGGGPGTTISGGKKGHGAPHPNAGEPLGQNELQGITFTRNDNSTHFIVLIWKNPSPVVAEEINTPDGPYNNIKCYWVIYWDPYNGKFKKTWLASTKDGDYVNDEYGNWDNIEFGIKIKK